MVSWNTSTSEKIGDGTCVMYTILPDGTVAHVETVHEKGNELRISQIVQRLREIYDEYIR